MNQTMYKKPNHKARPFFLPEIPLHLPPDILPPSGYIPRLFRAFQEQWKSGFVFVRHLVPHIIRPHILEQEARPHDLERLGDRMQSLVVPVHGSPANARTPWYTPLEHSLGPHVLERAAAALSGDSVHHPRGAVGDMHQDAVYGQVDGDLVDVALPCRIWEAGAEGDAEGGRRDDCGDPRRGGCGATDLVIWIGVAEGGSDDGGSYDQQLVAFSVLGEER